LQFNIWYHLALAHYVKGDLEAALEAYRSCMDVSVHPDSVVATAYWMYMTLRRLGRDAEASAVLARIGADMEIIESTAYLDLLLLYEGQRTYEEVVGPAGEEATLQSTTAGYGLGVWHLLSGRDEEALAMFRRVRTARNQWAAFGFIAAEGELARRMDGGTP
jgi:tetratricopeptide (TPR) repeat protein